MSDPSNAIDRPLTLLRFQGELMALRTAVAVLITTLPEAQKAAVCAQINAFAAASDTYNGELPAFSTGEEVTHEMNVSLHQLLGMVAAVTAVRTPT